MKKFVVAGILVLVGALSIGLGLASNKTGLSLYELHTYPVSEPFSSVSVQSAGFDVVFTVSDDDTCSVTCPENSRVRYDVRVADDTLCVEYSMSSSAWYEALLPSFGDSQTVTIRLPDCHYSALSVRSSSGNVDIPASCTFARVNVHTSSGDVVCLANTEDVDISTSSGDVTAHVPTVAPSVRIVSTSGDVVLTGAAASNPFCADLRVETTSGNVNVRNANVKSALFHSISGDVSSENLAVSGDLNAETTSGNVSLEHLSVSGSLNAKSISGTVNIRNTNAENTLFHSTSGDIFLENLFVKKDLNAESTSGDIRLTKCDGGSLNISTSSGDVSAVLASHKLFEVHSTSGYVRIPYESYGDPCRVTTISGDISLSVE